jgi:predicted DNA-binding transcriptional regulator YafY
MPDKKSRLLHTKAFLEERADELHPVTVAEIIAHLAESGITATRKTVAQDIDLLLESGLDIICNKSRQNQYFVGERHFETPELKLLIDAVQASKFLTAKRSRALIEKLLATASCHQRADLLDGIYFDSHIKPKNEQAYITADILLQAMRAKKAVRFMYYEYGPDKKKEYKHGRRVYEFSPWSFIWDSDKYYILGHSKHHGKAVTFRVDRIAAPKPAGKDAVPKPDDFDLAAYTKSVYQMYDGPMMDVTLKCQNTMMKVIIDRFGEDVHTKIYDSQYFTASISVSASKTFYGWVFSLDGTVKIIAPKEAVEEYRAMLSKA